jgi:hypothetical protein
MLAVSANKYFEPGHNFVVKRLLMRVIQSTGSSEVRRRRECATWRWVCRREQIGSGWS